MGRLNWYIGIWSAPISQKAIVWVANRDNPVKNMAGFLNFSSEGRLRLFDGQGRLVWSTKAGQRASRAVIADSGNFVILNDHAHNESAIVWERFVHPTDTWLPGMKFSKSSTKLTSWKSSSDPGSGLFSLRMDTTPGKSQLVLWFNNTIPYASTGECIGRNYCTKFPFLQGRFVLNKNGELQIYFRMDDNSWSLRCSTYRGQCSDYEICGAYGLCNANDVCSCVQGFAPKNGSQGWWSNGCVRRTPLHWSVTESTTDGFFEAKNQYLSEKEAVLCKNEPTQQGCRTACLTNCSCTAFSFAISDSPLCRLWFGDLLGMRVTSEGQSVFIRLAASELPHLTSEKIKSSVWMGQNTSFQFSDFLICFKRWN